MTDRSSRVLWSYPFRPFFLSVAAYAIVLMVGWIGVLTADWSMAGPAPTLWHAHEILVGVVGAAVAGFLLTAIANWTGIPALHGRGLVALWLTWLAGRAVFWFGQPFAGGAAGAVTAVIDLLFPLALLLAAGQVLIKAGNRRNYIMLLVLALFAAANGLMHFGPGAGFVGAHMAVDIIVVLMVIIGGRITPAFTRNWLVQQSRDGSSVRQRPRLDLATIVVTASVALVALIPRADPVVAALALLAAFLNAWRLSGWAGWLTLRNPLLWVLHLGYAWIVVALLLRGLGPVLEAVPARAWIHAAGVGAMGTLMIGVMSRVALGHTGRALALPATGRWMLLAISAAALARTATAMGWLNGSWALSLAAVLWIGAFGWLLVLYLNILTTARADGKPG